MASHHLPDENTSAPKPKAGKIIVISPADHVMLVGGKRTLNTEICRADGTKCKSANRGNWTMKPKGIIKLSNKKKSAQSTAEGIAKGIATVTVKQGGAAGSTTVKINEPPNRKPVAEAPELRLKLIPEHPDVREGVPYVMVALACPADASIANAGGGFAFIQNEIMTVADEARAWKEAGCVDSIVTSATPDDGFRVIYQNGNIVLLVKDEGAEGFSVSIQTEHGGDYPSDKISFFGADPNGEPLPGLEDVDLTEVTDEILDKYDMDGDRKLTPKDLERFDYMVRVIDDDEFGDDQDLSSGTIDRYHELTDIDNDGEPASTDDIDDFRETVGGLIVEAVMNSTPAEC